MSFLDVAVLAIVQGLAELLPVSSSAHVVVAEKLMGLDPSSSPMTLLLVMLHTGTMLAVIVYFFDRWRTTYCQSKAAFKRFAWHVMVATALTGVVGEGITKFVENIAFRGSPQVEIKDLFGHLELIAPALALAGVLILVADILTRRQKDHQSVDAVDLTTRQAVIIGIVQGLSLPFRGFSRSGSTISASMLAGTARARAENFSFALAVVLTPAAIGREVLRLIHAQHSNGMAAVALPSLLGVVLSFAAGLLALRWLSEWLENGRWYLFGIYCVVGAVAVTILHHLGY